MALHLFAFTRFGPAIEFLLKTLVGSCRRVGQVGSPMCNFVSFVVNAFELGKNGEPKLPRQSIR